MRLKANIKETIAALNKRRYQAYKSGEDTIPYETAMMALCWVLDNRDDPTKLEENLINN